MGSGLLAIALLTVGGLVRRCHVRVLHVILVAALLGSSPAARAGETSEPRLLSNPGIPYPRQAKELQVVGDVVFAARVDEKGSVTSVEVRSVPMRGVGFEDAVRDAVKKWRFRPAMVDGQPRAGEHLGRVSYVLRIRDEGAIGDIVSGFARAWNASDATAFATVFEPDEGQVRTPTGPEIKGQDAVLRWATERFTRARPQLATKWAGLHFYSADLATARIPVDGMPHDVYLMLMKKQGGWFVRSLEDRVLVEGVAPRDSPRRVGEEGIQPPRKIKGGPPAYPDDLKRAGIQGTVIVECVIAADGEVADARAVSGPLELRGVAEATVKAWRYTPTILDGEAVPVAMTITINFRVL